MAASQIPTGVVDRQLWRDAQTMLGQHVAGPDGSRCAACHRPWPCVARRAGERAEIAAFKPWNETWTARHDLRSLTPNGHTFAAREPAYNRGTPY